MPAGKAFWRFFSSARVLAWKRGPDCVKPGREYTFSFFLRHVGALNGTEGIAYREASTPL
jgi:hypothetical protein